MKGRVDALRVGKPIARPRIEPRDDDIGGYDKPHAVQAQHLDQGFEMAACAFLLVHPHHTRATGSILWANLHLLFWLSLVPFVTAWMGENHFAATPVALYGVVLLMAGTAYYILARALAAHHGQDSKLALALGKDEKGIASIAIYAIAIALASFSPALAGSLYVLVALMWLIPDRRMERALAE